ncbi:MAG: ATP-binding protein [Pseudomonadota bacterium]
MRYRKRILEEKILKLARQFPIIVLNGARQAGKSTLLDHLFGKKMRRVVFDPVIDVENARQDPELFLSLNPPPLILDEIQYVPNLAPVLKRLADERKDEMGLFFVTGSQQFAVIKSITESLAGRAAMLDLPGFSLKEIFETVNQPGLLLKLLTSEKIPKNITSLSVSKPNLAQLMIKGAYPRTLEMDEQGTLAWFESYLKTYVERDIRLLGDISDLQMFTRFTRLCAQLSAQEINHSHLGREIGVDPKTAKSWLSILKASYQWLEIPAYSGNTTKRLSEKPKGYFSDVGFACFLSSIFSATSLMSHPLFGNLFETFVVNEIFKQLHYLPALPALYHWRSHGGAEIDLIIEKDGKFWLIEAKLAARPSLKDLRGMQAFRETYPRKQIAMQIIVSGGNEIMRLDENTVVIPITEL